MFYYWKGTPNIKDLRTELTCLGHHKLLTITDRANQFRQRVSLEDFTMTTVNVQSFASHSTDVSTDPVLASTDILALTETRMGNGETGPVEGYKCFTQFKRQNGRAGEVAMYEKNNAAIMATPHILKKLDKKTWQRRRLN
jgi:hypothetical protein